MENLFEELHPKELREIIDSSGIAYLPLGTLEWHEEHLPFGTDAYIGYSLCKAACKKTDGCVIPPLFFGTDREHVVDGKTFHGMDAKAGKVLPGSIYFLKPELFFQLIKSMAENISQQGFRKLVIVSGHGGSAHIDEIKKLDNERIGEMEIIVFHPKEWVIEGLETGTVDHAGEVETSIFMSINQDLVRMGKLPKPYKGILRSDPHKASKEKGLADFSKIVEQLVSKVSGD
jgi:creatinine amidohydrolase